MTELADEQEVITNLRKLLGNKLLETEIPRHHRIFVRIDKKDLEKAIQHLVQAGFTHVSTLTAVDLGQDIELIYHLSQGGALELSLKVYVSKSEPSIPTMVTHVPGITLYEREVHDLFGVVFEGHPDLSPLILPEGWPSDVYPLRKELATEKLRNVKVEGEKA